jgi:4-hydroxy-3-methylbut-2-enyl diphosphate reductase
MIIEIAETAGYCFGVERAVKMAEDAAGRAEGRRVYTLGPVIHNEKVLEKLEREKGVRALKDLDGTHDSVVVIRAHGIPPELYEKAKAQGNLVMDATCPYVTRAQDLAKKLVDDGYTVILLGEHNHPEVIGIVGHAEGKPIVVDGVDELPDRPYWGKVGLIVQTTQRADKLAAIVNKLVPIAHEVKVHNTICSATDDLQEAAHKLARKVQAVVVIGGRQSGNTKRLAQICAEHQPRTYLVTGAEDMKEEWFEDVEHVGITAGASTPDFSIREVVDWLKAFAEKRDARRRASGQARAASA